MSKTLEFNLSPLQLWHDPKNIQRVLAPLCPVGQGQLQIWTEHSIMIFENLKPVEKSKNHFNINWTSSNVVLSFKIRRVRLQNWAWLAKFLSLTLLILKINKTFEDVQMMVKWFFDISTGFRFSKISVECSIHICSSQPLQSIDLEENRFAMLIEKEIPSDNLFLFFKSRKKHRKSVSVEFTTQNIIYIILTDSTADSSVKFLPF